MLVRVQECYTTGTDIKLDMLYQTNDKEDNLVSPELFQSMCEIEQEVMFMPRYQELCAVSYQLDGMLPPTNRSSDACIQAVNESRNCTNLPSFVYPITKGAADAKHHSHL